MTEINKDMTIGDILDAERDTAPFFLEMGMHCLGCPASRGETVEQACMVHGVDPDVLVENINEFLKGKNNGLKKAVLKTQPLNYGNYD